MCIVVYLNAKVKTVFVLVYDTFLFMFIMCFFMLQMPHESTVEHDVSEAVPEDMAHGVAMRARSITENAESDTAKRNSSIKPDSMVPHLRAETPRKLTHHHDEDDSDEENGALTPIELVLDGIGRD